MIAPRQILGVEILYQFSWLYQALLFYHINTLFRILSSLPQCNQGDQKCIFKFSFTLPAIAPFKENETNLDNSNEDDFDTSNGNNIDLTEFDEPKIEVSSIDDILADVHHYVGKLTGDKGIIPSDYLVSFKPEESTGVGAQLVDL
ncbi:hypothetical protein GLOIN_2v1479183 [Rhizophagus irregularis DAOM 181602=DAOM 197198]|nr:hypothetical protein GLOIN_2v1479183 [Rhizophagus irregularis DAOM 181602=DAOM 197198]